MGWPGFTHLMHALVRIAPLEQGVHENVSRLARELGVFADLVPVYSEVLPGLPNTPLAQSMRMWWADTLQGPLKRPADAAQVIEQTLATMAGTV